MDTSKITKSLTPMMQQYMELKEQYSDTLLFYRMGDFYEMFFEDAELASRILGITLTSRDKQAENPVPMCGVPYHASDGYIAKLLEAGHKVAICEQVEDPRKAKGLVKRQVVRVLTPGLVTDEQNLQSKSSNYLAAVFKGKKKEPFGFSYLDITTADYRVTEIESTDELLDELARISPRELIVPEHMEQWFKNRKIRLQDTYINFLEDDYFDFNSNYERLTEHFKVHSLAGFGCEEMKSGIVAAGVLLEYLLDNHQYNNSHLRTLKTYRREEYMVLDDITLRNLEIFYSAAFRGEKGTLLETIDKTKTPMGGRLLREWLRFPLKDIPRIQSRQEAVQTFIANEPLREQIRQELDKMFDMERLNSRVVMKLASPRDLGALRTSFSHLPTLNQLLETLPDTTLLEQLKSGFDTLEDLAELLEQALVDDPPVNSSEGGFIREGYKKELDKIRAISWDAKNWMARYESQERERTGIGNLKVRYNKVFGYFIEVSKSNLSNVPEYYIRKQTLVNAERFITEELKKYETAILESEEKRIDLEQQLLDELRARIAHHDERIRKVAKVISTLDVLTSFADVATRNDYCCPEVHDMGSIVIRDGRHPVVEKYLGQESFVPNDTEVNNNDQQVLIITGPNMAGKSTIIRQVALIVYLAHVGAFVPASSASIGLVDRIFTRVGAMDDLARGRSTFMVEMEETANILRHVTSRSLVILDEIGRGTSTFDGLSIAWAVAEYLHNWNNVGVKTLFATHYHEMTQLSNTCPRVKNLNILAKEWKNEVIFLRKLVPGSGNRSYGIQVARLAGLPEEVLQRADQILHNLEKERKEVSPKLRNREPKKSRKQKIPAGFQLPLFDYTYLESLKKRILEADVNNMTPIEALNFLNTLKKWLLKKSETPDLFRFDSTRKS